MTDEHDDDLPPITEEIDPAELVDDDDPEEHPHAVPSNLLELGIAIEAHEAGLL
jgi:hypothetical protein